LSNGGHMRKTIIAATVGLFVLMGGLTSSSVAAGSPDGRTVFEKRCTGCHALDREKVGPRLGAIFGRKAAGVSSYSYSDAMKTAKITGDGKTRDQWLADPDRVIPGNDMSFRLENSAERAAIIEYLRQMAGR